MPISNAEIFDLHLQYLSERLPVEAIESFKKTDDWYRASHSMTKDEMEGISFNEVMEKLKDFTELLELENSNLVVAVSILPMYESQHTHFGISVKEKDLTAS